MILERKAKKIIKISNNVTIDPARSASDWADIKYNWKKKGH